MLKVVTASLIDVVGILPRYIKQDPWLRLLVHCSTEATRGVVQLWHWWQAVALAFAQFGSMGLARSWGMWSWIEDVFYDQIDDFEYLEFSLGFFVAVWCIGF